MLICFQFLNKSARFYSHVQSRFLRNFFLLSFPLLCYMLHFQAFSVQMFTFSIRSVFNLATFIPVCFFSLELVAFCTLPLFAFMLTQYIYVIPCMATTKKILKIDCGLFFRLYIFVVSGADQ